VGYWCQRADEKLGDPTRGATGAFCDEVKDGKLPKGTWWCTAFVYILLGSPSGEQVIGV